MLLLAIIIILFIGIGLASCWVFIKISDIAEETLFINEED